MTLSGTIENIRYCSGKGFAVLDIRDDSGTHRVLAGKIYDPKDGMRIIAEGEFVRHPQYGQQFSVTSCRIEIVKDTTAIVQYLSSGLFTGVGPSIARAIVNRFGVNVVEEIIEKDYEKLTEVPRVTKTMAERIHRQHAENFVYQELAGMGLSLSQIHKLYDKYAEKAVEVLKKTPYQPIYDIDGFGFKTVDTIALKAGIARNSHERLAAGITFVLTDIGNQGHCWCHIDNLAALIQNLLPEISPKLLADAVQKELDRKKIIQEKEKVYALSLYEAEKNAAMGLAKMIYSSRDMSMAGEMPVAPKKIQAAIEEAEAMNGFELDVYQKQAISSALQNRVSVITGGPGSGKTTIISAIIDGWMSQFSRREDPEDHVLLCAPTGKAARRMSELTGIHAETIQRILMRQSKSRSEWDEDKNEHRKLIILDEASMMDIVLASKLINFASEKHFLVLIGDVDQLPPIGPGYFFRDCIQSPFVPTTRLNLSHRQKGTIAINAKRINDGQGMYALNLDDPSFQFIPADKPAVQEAVIQNYINLLHEGYKQSDICCAVPIAKAGRSQTSASDLNILIRERVNPAPYGEKDDPKVLRVGDRVINTENDYDAEVFNGDCGTVASIDNETGVVQVKLDDGRYVEFNKARASFLSLAYALTVHKLQGSEYKAVVVAHSLEHNFMLQRSLLYTAVTRAKEKVLLIGDENAVNIAVNRIPALERNTCLRERLKTLMTH